MSNYSNNAKSGNPQNTLLKRLHTPGGLFAILLGSVLSGIVIFYINALPIFIPGTQAPLPFLLLFASVVFSSIFWGLRSGLASAAVSSIFIIYAVEISFGPESLTGHPAKGILGILLYFIAAFFLGKTKDQNAELLSVLKANESDLEAKVNQRTAALQDAVNQLQQESVLRKESEKALKFQKKLLECQMEALPGAILIVSENREMQLFNHKFLDLWQIPKSVIDDRSNPKTVEVLKKQVVDSEAFLKRIEHIYAHPEMETRDVLFLKDGQIFERFTAPVIGEDGQFSGRIWYFQDVTELKYAEELLKTREERYYTLFEESPVSFLEKDFSSIKKYLDHLINIGTTDIRAYLYSHPEEVLQQTQTAKVLDFNKKSMELYECDTIDSLLSHLNHYNHKNLITAFTEIFCAISAGADSFEKEIEIITAKNQIKHVLYKFTVVPGYKDTYSRVLIALVDISERIAAEKSVKESEEKFRQIVETANEGIWVIDKENKTSFVNNKMAEMLGYTIEEMMGKTLFMFMNDEGREIAAKNVERRKQGITEQHEFKFQRKDGTILWALLNTNPLFDNNKTYAGALAMVTDITVRKKVDLVIKEQAEYTKKLLDATLDGYILADPQGNILQVNQSYCQMVGYSEDELLTMNIRDLEGKLKPEEIEKRVADMLRHGGARFETRHQCKNGTMIDLDVSIVIITETDSQKVSAFVRDISESKQNLMKLQKSEERFESLLQSLNDVVWAAKADGSEMLYINDAAEKIYGRPRSEFLTNANASMWLEAVHPEDRDWVTQESQKLIEKGNTELEYRIIRPDGRIRWLNDRKSVVFDESGKPLRIGGIARDITALKRVEEKYRSLYTEAPIMYLVTQEVNGVPKIRDVNQEFLKLLGYRAEEVIGCDLIKFYSPDSQKELLEHGGFQRALLGAFNVEERTLVTKDGQIIDTILKALPEYDTEGNAIGTRAMYVDITERRKAETTLIESEERFRQIAETIREIFWMFDVSEQNMIYISPAFETIWGIRREEMYKDPMTFYKAIHPDDQPSVMEKINRQQVGESTDIEYRVLRPDGSQRWIRDRGFPIKDQNGNVYRITGIAEDITERKNAQLALEKTSTQMQALATHLQTVREDERTMIAREIHDEVGQILTVLKLDLSFIEGELNKPTEEIDISVIHAEIETINELLDQTSHKLSQLITELRPEIIDNLGLLPAIEWQVKEFQKRTGINCQLKLSVKNLKFNNEYSTAIYRIVQESLTNVLRHSQANKVKINIRQSNEFLKIEIKDNGIGIGQQQIDAMNSFGLVGMKERAIILGGELQISGKPGHGTTLIVSIPISKMV